MCNIDNIIDNIIGAFEKAQNECAPVQNFFSEVWGNLNENDHTRILLAILRTEVELSNGKRELPFLIDFCKTFRIFNVDAANVTTADIRFNEYYQDGERNFIDGLVISQKDPRFAIIIENKVCGATDQKLQLDRYIASCIKDITQPNAPTEIVIDSNLPANGEDKIIDEIIAENIWAIYLTANGGAPSDKSYNTHQLRYKNDTKPINTNIGEQLLCLNYKDDILPWLERIKYQLPGTMHNCVVSYIDYLKQMLQLNNAKLQDEVTEILKKYGTIIDSNKEKTYSKLTTLISDLQSEIKTANNGEVLSDDEIKSNANRESLKNIVGNIKDDFERPYWDEFYNLTQKYFEEEKRKKIKINKIRYNSQGKGYIQIRGAEWDYHVHYEWFPITFKDLFFNQEDLKLCIHIEGNTEKIKQARNDCKINDINETGKSIDFPITRNKSCYEMIKANNNEFEKWLSEAYKEVITYWGDLESVSNKIKHQISYGKI